MLTVQSVAYGLRGGNGFGCGCNSEQSTCRTSFSSDLRWRFSSRPWLTPTFAKKFGKRRSTPVSHHGKYYHRADRPWAAHLSPRGGASSGEVLTYRTHHE